ncbi:hypothetical protein AA18895_1804 [Acetobacter ghanensis DSM 18895]|nr:hypothetical protein AA18895_1804 [Acetobacter ghanensis DSM 18895]
MSGFLSIYPKPDSPFAPPIQPQRRETVPRLHELKRLSPRGQETIRLSFREQTLSLRERPWNTPRKDPNVLIFTEN